MFASRYRLSPHDAKALRVTDTYSLHRVVYGLFDDVREGDREKGSGIRIFIDEMCKKLEIDPDKLRGYEDEASSHMIAATNVLRGSADVAIGIEKVASQMQGLDFIPLKQESYDIVFRKKDLKRSEFQKLLNIIRSDEFKSEAETMSGYDVSEMGKQLW